MLPSRGSVFGAHLRSAATVSVQIVAVSAALWILAWVVGEAWVIILPVALAVVVCTVLWPPVRWMRSKGVPPAAAALLMLLVAIGVIAGLIAAVAPAIVEQSTELAEQVRAAGLAVTLTVAGTPAPLQAPIWRRRL